MSSPPPPPPGRPPPRPITRLLVANRGEIASRILSTASELSITTYALCTATDTAHTHLADHSLELPSPDAYLDINLLISLVKQHAIDTVHPGYGFLSESAEFAERMWREAGAVVVGPGWEVLARTGDKVVARELAQAAGVPVLPALARATGSVDEVARFADQVGYPVMVKAVDGGGGRGIRLVKEARLLEREAARAIQESPSKQVFVEKAAVDGYLHVEVQIVGDGTDVVHLYERQCSIQRRYQKVVEVAPCVSTDRAIIDNVIRAAMAMARKVSKTSSLSTPI
jgi:pyruvate carboxylase